ncbi:RcnB family protein [Massilia sp. G4R7]|uniref:RcnB family protein n=1 Tax=Massilia phyllostachyos TaxID=2898585 RepID=A0ABS8QEF9_9BURK|nr:RcnB family protein [Massilia phyllostachyos]MCD2519215.1 RcnB family protein [Massilia phyllostachyos]
MKSKIIASALITLTLAASGSALAQRGDHGHDRDNRYGHSQYDGRRDYDRHDDRRGYDNDRRGGDRYYDARNFRRDDYRGGGPRHDLRRGHRLSHEYRGNRYVVSDWRARHLSAPPRGHHWVRAGNDYVLAAIATGLIAQVLLSN